MTGHNDKASEHSFGAWRFHADTGDLDDGESITRLEPKVARLLAFFLAHQHRVITRDELIATVWENRVVSDDAINRCISILRQKLSPDDKNALIETVVRKGYLAHFPPAPSVDVEAGWTTQVAQTVRQWAKLVLFAVAVAGAATLMFYRLAGSPTASRPVAVSGTNGGPPMVAVLPFSSAGEGGESEFFAAGVQDDLLTQLTKLQSMRVISSTSVREYRNTPRNIRKIGKELGADAILEGGVQIANNRIRINAQLIDARTDEHLWAETYEREFLLAKIFEVQADIAGAVARAMNATLTAQEKEQIALIPTENMAAYRAYRRAMRIRDTGSMSDPEYLKAFEEAVALDPTFRRAWAELVSTLTYLNFYGDHTELTRRAEEALERLKALAPDSVEYRIAQAAYLYNILKDYDRADKIITEVTNQYPSDVRALELRSWIERLQGDFDAKLASARLAVELDPRNPVWSDIVLRMLVMMHRYDDAWSEMEGPIQETYRVGYTRNLLRFREHRDFGRLEASMAETCHLHAAGDTGCGWDFHIANRNYPAALDSLGNDERAPQARRLLFDDFRRITTYLLMDDEARLRDGMSLWSEDLQADANGAGEFFHPDSYIYAALLAGIRGERAEAERLIGRFFHRKPIDWWYRIYYRSDACRVLGMISAT
ncbi:MAG: winged helix-turn-helix domain-containing protein, partial [Xanthomonadales bacterium]|nr:winged helix-turn-helix domain-containing protein [Xanthomonadales bacterium]